MAITNQIGTPADAHTPLPAGAGRVFLAVCGCILAAGLCLEGAVRVAGYTLPRWYPQVEQDQAWRAASDRVVFVGTSRTFASVDERRLAAERAVGAVNMGQGFSTITTHALGIRYLAERGALAGTTVFVEAPGGMPDASTWHDPWYSIERPQWLLSVMSPADLPALWRSATPVEDAFAATFRGLAVGSRFFAYREDVRVTSLGWIYDRARGRTPVSDEDFAGGDEDIVLPARRNPADRARIRAAAVLDGQRWLVGTREVRWDTTVVATLVETVHAAGGRVIFLTIPLSGPMSVGLRTPIALANQLQFDAALARWGATRLAVPVTFTDDDFPDLWHISRQGRDRFTAAVINAWSPGDRR
jgi:hypothetical protein